MRHLFALHLVVLLLMNWAQIMRNLERILQLVCLRLNKTSLILHTGIPRLRDVMSARSILAKLATNAAKVHAGWLLAVGVVQKLTRLLLNVLVVLHACIFVDVYAPYVSEV